MFMKVLMPAACAAASASAFLPISGLIGEEER